MSQEQAAEFDESSLTPYDAARRARVEIEAEILWNRTVKGSGYGRMPEDLAALEQGLADATEREREVLREAMVASDSDEARMLNSAAQSMNAVASTVNLSRAGAIRNYHEAQRRLKDAVREVAVAQAAAAEAGKAMVRLVNRPLRAWGNED